jgi:heme-degrading monooxygenase HmoA
MVGGVDCFHPTPNTTMNYLLIRHRVADFARWKSAYDAHAGARAGAGLTERELLHDVNDANQVVMLFEVADLGKAQAFSQSDNLREAMRAAGVTDKPDIYFLRR